MKELDSINNKSREKNEARVYINDVNEALLEYYRAFAKQIKGTGGTGLFSSTLNKWQLRN